MFSTVLGIAFDITFDVWTRKKTPWLDTLVPQKWPAITIGPSSPVDPAITIGPSSPVDLCICLYKSVYIYKQHMLYLHYDRVDIIREYICEQQHVDIYI